MREFTKTGAEQLGQRGVRLQSLFETILSKVLKIIKKKKKIPSTQLIITLSLTCISTAEFGRSSNIFN